MTKVAEHVAAAFSRVSAISTVVGLTVLLMLQIPTLGPLFDKVGLNDSEAVRTTLVVLILTAMSGQIHEVQRRLRKQDSLPRRRFDDPVDIFHFLVDMGARAKTVEEKRLEILGVHLGEILPLLTIWLERPEADGWTIDIAVINDESHRLDGWIPDDWRGRARQNANIALDLAASKRLTQRHISLNVLEYCFPPVVYGVRLGNGDVVISLMPWGTDGRLGRFGLGFEHVTSSEMGANAAAQRQLFASWFTQVKTQNIRAS